MNKYVKLLKNTILVFGGNIGSKVITLLMMPLYTRWLSVEGYGITDMLTIYVTLLLSIVSCCIPEALFVFPSGQVDEKKKEYFSSGFAFNLLTFSISAAIFWIVDILDNYAHWNNTFTQNIWFIYTMLVTQVLQQQSQQFARSSNHMIVYSLTGLIYTICVAAFSFLFVPRYGVPGYVYSIIIANIISAAYSFLFSRAYDFLRVCSVKIDIAKEMLRYSIPLIPNSIMWWLVNALNRPMMENTLGLHDIGIYAVANRFPGILSMVFTVFATSWQISVIEEYRNNGFEDFYNKVFKIVFSSLSILLICVTFSSKLLISVFADSQFFEAWKYVAILSFGTMISCMSGFLGSIFSATRESKYYLYSSIWGAIISILLNYFLIPSWGLYGAAISILISFFTISISRILYSWRTVKIKNVSYYIFVLVLLGIIILFYIKSSLIWASILSFIASTYMLYMNRHILNNVFNSVKNIRK